MDKTFPTDLQAEIDYRLDLREDTAADEGETFDRTTDAAIYEAIRDMEDCKDSMFTKHLRLLRQWQIDRGVYEAMSPEEVRNTTTTRGTVWDFKMAGQPYKFRRHIED